MLGFSLSICRDREYNGDRQAILTQYRHFELKTAHKPFVCIHYSQSLSNHNISCQKLYWFDAQNDDFHHLHLIAYLCSCFSSKSSRKHLHHFIYSFESMKQQPCTKLIFYLSCCQVSSGFSIHVPIKGQCPYLNILRTFSRSNVTDHWCYLSSSQMNAAWHPIFMWVRHLHVFQYTFESQGYISILWRLKVTYQWYYYSSSWMNTVRYSSWMNTVRYSSWMKYC